MAALALSENSPYAHVSGDRVYYRPSNGVFTVTATLTDTPAGLELVVFPTTTSAGAVYALNGASNVTVSHGYAFTPSSTESGLNFPVTASDRAGNVVTQTFDVERDATAPAVTVNAPGRIYSSTIPVSWTVAELGSGATGVYTVSVMTDTGPLQPWLAGTSLTSGNFTGVLGHRYTFVVTTTDRVNNLGQGTAETIATQVTKYYYIGSSRVAMRQGDAVTYLHTDHLGTVSVATSGNGQFIARTLNLPYGGVRWTDGTMPTDYSFTGQKLDTYIKLIQMGARWYDPQIGRWISPDSIVPQAGDPQTLNRYSYTNNNPVKYIDPTGHKPCDEQYGCEGHDYAFLDLRKLGFEPGIDIDPLVYEFYRHPDWFDVTASVEFDDRLSGGLAAGIAWLLGQGRIPDRLGEDEHYPVRSTIEYDSNGEHRWLREALVGGEYQVIFDATWKAKMHSGRPMAKETFDLSNVAGSWQLFFRDTVLDPDHAVVYLEANVDGRSLTWRSTNILISPHQDENGVTRYADLVKLARWQSLDVSIVFRTSQTGPNTIRSVGQLIVNERVLGNVMFDGTYNPR